MSLKPFDCIICFESKLENRPRYVGDHRICNACAEESVKPLFGAALQHDHQYPPMCGSKKLDIWVFWDLFDDDFKEKWHQRIEEYAVPVKDRLYCKYRDGRSGEVCAGFLGKKGQGDVLCTRWKQRTCRNCGVGIGSGSSRYDHKCTKAAPTRDPFEGMTLGKDYRRCAGCQHAVLLADGCNHMVCPPPCNTDFCFVCGEKVAVRFSGHWHPEGCPRYGVPGGDCSWDDPDFHSDDDDDSDDSSDTDTEMSSDEDEDEEQRAVARVEQLMEIFEEAADAERVGYNKWSIDARYRIAFFEDLSLNLSIVREKEQTQFHGACNRATR